jgi:hypothetical protein
MSIAIGRLYLSVPTAVTQSNRFSGWVIWKIAAGGPVQSGVASVTQFPNVRFLVAGKCERLDSADLFNQLLRVGMAHQSLDRITPESPRAWT